MVFLGLEVRLVVWGLMQISYQPTAMPEYSFAQWKASKEKRLPCTIPRNGASCEVHSLSETACQQSEHGLLDELSNRHQARDVHLQFFLMLITHALVLQHA